MSDWPPPPPPELRKHRATPTPEEQVEAREAIERFRENGGPPEADPWVDRCERLLTQQSQERAEIEKRNASITRFIDRETETLARMGRLQAELDRAVEREKGLLAEIRGIARGYAPPEPGAAGYEVEGRVIASDLFAVADMWDSALAASPGKGAEGELLGADLADPERVDAELRMSAEIHGSNPAEALRDPEGAEEGAR